MRYLVSFVCVVALLASPVAAGAQEPNTVEPAQSTQPPRSRVERWHPEAFEDPKKPAPEPALKLEIDSSALEVTPTAPPTLEELERQKRGRRIGIGVGVSLAIVAIVAIAGTVAARNSIERGFQ